MSYNSACGRQFSSWPWLLTWIFSRCAVRSSSPSCMVLMIKLTVAAVPVWFAGLTCTIAICLSDGAPHQLEQCDSIRFACVCMHVVCVHANVYVCGCTCMCLPQIYYRLRQSLCWNWICIQQLCEKLVNFWMLQQPVWYTQCVKTDISLNWRSAHVAILSSCIELAFIRL